MLVLGFDTATPYGTMALVENNVPILDISLNAGKGGGEYLLSILEMLLKKVNRKVSEIELIIVGTGPGSYTGIRVGLAAAKGLSASLEVPVYGLNTLRIIAENARYSYEWIASVLDARRGEVYAALYHNKGDINTVETPMIIAADKFSIALAELPKVLICGNAGEIYKETWLKYPNLQLAPIDWNRPFGYHVAQIGLNEFKKKKQDEEITPCYLRKVEAELRLEEKLNATKNRTDEG